MLDQLRPAVVMLIAFTVITGIATRSLMTGVAGLLFPDQAGGNLIEREGKVVGSEPDRPGVRRRFSTFMVGHRPPAYGYDARFLQRLEPRPDQSSARRPRTGPHVERLKAENPGAAVPIDLVTASGSGLDPHISPAGARFQGAEGRSGARPVGGRGACAARRADRRSNVRTARGAARQCAASQPRPRRPLGQLTSWPMRQTSGAGKFPGMQDPAASTCSARPSRDRRRGLRSAGSTRVSSSPTRPCS